MHIRASDPRSGQHVSRIPRPARRGGSRDALLLEIARAYYERELSQEAIGLLHGLSRSQVSRYLTAARQEGIVQIRVVSRDEDDPGVVQSLRRAFPRLREVVVAKAFNPDPRYIRRSVASAAARLFDRLIHPGMTVCVGAGRTMALAAEGLTERRTAGLVVVPATGDAGHTALEFDYSAVATSVADRLGGIAHRINAPAIVGPGSSAAALTRAIPQIEDTLRLARQADLFLLGLGSLGGDEIFVEAGTISSEELSIVRSEGAVGDLCGNFFDAVGHPVGEPFRDRVIGISLDDLRQAALVVACAAGEEKAPAVLGALQGGFIEGLVTDEATARRVLAGIDGYPHELPGAAPGHPTHAERR
jgi:DNA-binding transcriptional regulator LsrR (DeoR family)